MKLNLQNPLAFFDLETTGVDVAKDRIVEISIVKVNPDNSRDTFTRRVNPTVPIPPQSSAIHGIFDKDVITEPTFEYLAQEVFDFLDECDLAGYNSNRFDIPLIIEEFLRVSDKFDISDRRFVDVQTIFHKMEQRTLVAAYKFYCGKELENAHSAEADVIATLEVLESQLDKYPELENDVDFLQQFSRGDRRNADFAGRIGLNEDDQEIFNFGKHKDKTVEHVFTTEPSYYNWMMNAEFPQFTKQVITKVWRRMRENNYAD